MKNQQIELTASELEAISGGDFGSILASAGMAVVGLAIGMAITPVIIPAAAGYGVAMVVVGMGAFVEGAWISY